MKLTQEQSDFFFMMYFRILYYAYSGVSKMSVEEFFDSDSKIHIGARDLLLDNRFVVDEYINQLKDTNLPIKENELLFLESVKKARYTDFIVVEKEDNIYFVDYKDHNTIYLISGLTQDPEELFPFFPCLSKSVIFNYEGMIVSDGIHVVKPKKYPPNAAKAIIRDFNEDINSKLRSII
jgi:hypothetical protein